jgi:quinol monooxygenase YgiN
VTNYYVYYRIDARRVDAFRLSVQDLFKAIERETGVRGRWMRRRDDPLTYMEVYEGVRDAAVFEALLERECKGFGLQRRNEIFTEIGNQ